MSFLDTLKGFGGWVAKQWTKIFNAVPQIEHIADGVFAYAVPAIQIIIGMVDPPVAAIIAPILSEVQKDITVVSGLVYDFGASPTAANMVSAIEKDLNDLLTAGHIKDQAVIDKINLVIKTIGSLATALESAVAK